MQRLAEAIVQSGKVGQQKTIAVLANSGQFWNDGKIESEWAASEIKTMHFETHNYVP